jgi:hypothetical protein
MTLHGGQLRCEVLLHAGQIPADSFGQLPPPFQSGPRHASGYQRMMKRYLAIRNIAKPGYSIVRRSVFSTSIETSKLATIAITMR